MMAMKRERPKWATPYAKRKKPLKSETKPIVALALVYVVSRWSDSTCGEIPSWDEVFESDTLFESEDYIRKQIKMYSDLNFKGSGPKFKIETVYYGKKH